MSTALLWSDAFVEIAKVEKFSPDQPRIPGGNPGGGQFASTSGPIAWQTDDDSPGVVGNAGNAKEVRERWIKAAKNEKLADILAAAPANQAALGKVGEDIQKATGAKFTNPGIKTNMARIEEKVAKYGGDPRRLTDITRASFIVQTPEQADKVATMVASKYPVIDEGWVKTPVGYFDRKILLRHPDGSMGEVQLIEPNLHDAKQKGGGHKLYEVERSPKSPPVERKRAAIKQRMVYATASIRMNARWQAVYNKR